ncbi:response regulator transcription factor [Luteimonas sp. BDR2-5]|uniref:response regulator transcription factor n=1 Tax=Proluteimonas luteida TaxID=2878685 RepID=UPI001E52A556|nr:response regulator transcription factor [Luteimonas sp. BDR2-5]MCD9027968.1 response regulator transcription factor [Luteimonas sp. BDR2-5]
MTPRSGTAIRVAVLDDDDSLRERILLPELREHGFDAFGAATAAGLYRSMLRDRFDVALLDIGLPDEDGVSVAGHLREAYPYIGIVMLTGNRDRDSHLQSLVSGADAFLPKPVDIDILMATLHRLVKRMAAAREPLQPAAPGQRPAAAGTPGQWRLDADGWCLSAPGGEALALTMQERDLMQRLMATPGEPVRREDLIAALVRAGDIHDFDPRRLDMLVHRLRRKVANLVGASPPFPLLVARGIGYLFAA